MWHVRCPLYPWHSAPAGLVAPCARGAHAKRAVALAVVCGLGGMVGTCYVRYLRYETKAYCDCFAGGSTSGRHKLTAAMLT